MGLLSGITNFVNNKVIQPLNKIVAEKVSVDTRKKVVSAVDTALTILTSPIGAVTNFKKAKEETSKKSTTKLVAEGIETTLIAVAPFTSAGKTLATKAVTTAFSSVKNTAITLVGAGAVATSPTIKNAIVQAVTPSNYIQAGEKIGNVVEGFNQDQKTLTEKVIQTGLIGLGGVAVVGASIPVIKALIPDKEEKVATLPPTPEPTKNLSPSVMETNTEKPFTPETTTITTGTTRKKAKKRKSKISPTQNIIQKTNILINNSNKTTKFQTKKYLNERVL